jgi:hypothetical protein
MNPDKKENLTWFLVAISPITFGVLIVCLILITTAKYYNIDLKENGFIVVPIYIGYTWVWSYLYRTVAGHSWLD